MSDLNIDLLSELVPTLALPALSATPPNVLLVDDQVARLLTYEAILEELPVRLVRALSANEALQHLLSQEFAVIVLDVSMPEMDGFELARAIRDHPRLERTPIIFVTGVNVTDMDQLQGYEAGAIDYIAVPLVPVILRSKVALLIELHQRRKELQLVNQALQDSRDSLVTKHARALADSEAQLRAIFEHPTQVAVVLRAVRDPDGIIVDWTYQNANSNALQLLQHDLQSLTGRKLSEIRGASATETNARYREVLESRVPMHYDTLYDDRHFSITLFAIGDDMVVSSALDVTEQHRLQNELIVADRRKDDFLAMLAHELRNPVAPIRNAAEILARSLPADHPTRSAVVIIRRQTEYLARLLDDLLDVARVTQGRIELRRETINFARVVHSALETLDAETRKKGHRIKLDLSAEALVIHADKIRIEQCIVNVVANALKFTEPTGKIEIRTYVNEADAVLEITDSGVGIPPDFLPNVFDLFAQSERPLDRTLGGLGVGLSVCKRLIEMHEGRITASSEGIGKGSVFTIRLPRISKELAPEVAHTHTDRSRRILVVDDNRDSADSLQSLLGIEGHVAQTAYSGEEALSIINTFQPEIVFLDIGLPKLDGYEVVRRIKSFPNAPIVAAMTGYGQERDRDRAKEAGFDHHFVKPLDSDRVLDWLSQQP